MIDYPVIVALLCNNFDAWIVGSAADPNNSNPRDYDVLVPFYNWGPASALIPKDSTVNSFGGWKCIEKDKPIDIWPGDLGWIMQNSKAKWCYHPRSGIRLEKKI